MPLPPSLNTVTVVGSYTNLDGSVPVGKVTFTPDVALINTVANEIVIPKTLEAILNASGDFSIAIPASDDPDFAPTGVMYTVKEDFPGGRTFGMLVPIATVGNLDLADVVPAAIVGTASQYVLKAEGNQPSGYVATTVNGGVNFTAPKDTSTDTAFIIDLNTAAAATKILELKVETVNKYTFDTLGMKFIDMKAQWYSDIPGTVLNYEIDVNLGQITSWSNIINKHYNAATSTGKNLEFNSSWLKFFGATNIAVEIYNDQGGMYFNNASGVPGVHISDLGYFFGNGASTQHRIKSRTTTPEAAETAPPGSLVLVDSATARDDALWVKMSGTGNTGWRRAIVEGTNEIDFDIIFRTVSTDIDYNITFGGGANPKISVNAESGIFFPSTEVRYDGIFIKAIGTGSDNQFRSIGSNWFAPEGNTGAHPGSLYIDAQNNILYHKASGTTTAGWTPLGTKRKTSTKTASYTLTLQDDIVVFNATTLTATLPAANTVPAGKTLTIKNIFAGNLTVARTGTDTIDGATSQTLAQWANSTYMSDGTGQWWSI